MKLSAPTSVNISEIMSWFENEQQLKIWSGPNFRYPFDQTTFIEDLNLDSLDSFVLISDDFQLLAFGQCYKRVSRCHLGRLVVAPKWRGKGVIIKFITLISEYGMNKFNVQDCSLFVLEKNRPAIKAYEKIGFITTNYPDVIPLDNCLYMIK